MRKTLLASASLAVILTACDETPPQTSAARQAPETVAVAQIELRDFTVDGTEDTFQIEYLSHGSLVAKDNGLKNGLARIYLAYKQEPHKDDNRYRHTVSTLREGIGTVEIVDSTIKDLSNIKDFRLMKEKKTTTPPPFKYFGWKSDGYIRMQPASVTLAESAPAPSNQAEAAERPVRFGIRDLSSTEVESANRIYLSTRGTLLSKDPKLNAGTFLVYLTANQKVHGKSGPWGAPVIVRNGVGTFKMTGGMRDKPAVYSNWQIDGYVPLHHGHLIASDAKAEETIAANSDDAAFELRDVGFNSTIQGSNATSYSGRGTLVAHDARLQAGQFIVYTQAVVDGSDTQHIQETLLKDGVGSLAFHHFAVGKDNRSFKVADWRILGYARLQPAEIVPSNRATP